MASHINVQKKLGRGDENGVGGPRRFCVKHLIRKMWVWKFSSRRPKPGEVPQKKKNLKSGHMEPKHLNGSNILATWSVSPVSYLHIVSAFHSVFVEQTLAKKKVKLAFISKSLRRKWCQLTFGTFNPTLNSPPPRL